MCDKTFNRQNIFNRHLKREHGVVMHDYEYSDVNNAMYAAYWRRFLAYFEAETSRPYGKVIIDLPPATKRRRTDLLLMMMMKVPNSMFSFGVCDLLFLLSIRNDRVGKGDEVQSNDE